MTTRPYVLRFANASTPSIFTALPECFDLDTARTEARRLAKRMGVKYVVSIYDTIARKAVK